MKVAFHTLGCKVNQYESEAMSGKFKEAGHDVVDEREYADVYIINTCTVTSVADKKSRQYIRRMKKVNPESIIVVTGCYAQISPEEVAAVDGVDIVTGTNEKHRIIDYINEFAEDGKKQIHIKGYEELDVYEDIGSANISESRTRAYIKVQEGCNRFCSYCVIPYARGRVRSRDFNDIIKEAETLIGLGYKEIVLTGINTALYGLEEEGAREEDVYGIEKIIAAINSIEGEFRIRLSSLEPAVVNADYVQRLLKYDKLCHHMHLSAQSGSNAVLEAMNRPYNRDEYIDIVRVLRREDPYYGISTDIIVGFPGEREVDFEDSCKLVEECEFCKTHIFKYSKRPFTKAAEMKGHVAPQVKNRRSDDLHRLSKRIATEFYKKSMGREAVALFEEMHIEKKMLTGYTDNYTRVYLPFDDEVEAKKMINTFVHIRLLDCFEDGMRVEVSKMV